MDNLYFAPGETFSQNLDLLTRYQPDLAGKITAKFYSPTWMKKEIPERVTVNIASMRNLKEESLPHLCAQQQVWAIMKNDNLGANKFTKQPTSDPTLKGSLHSTGSWGLQRKEKCLPPAEGGATCLMCDTAPLQQASPKDITLLNAAKEKHTTKPS
jgi:hypothetical protein